MIETLQGLGVGAGKSYYAVCRTINTIYRGGTVFVSDSMHLLPDKIAQLCARRYRVRIEPDQIRTVPADEIHRIHEITAGGTEDNPVLIILDEAQDGLNARGWNEQPKEKRALFAWCCQSRHDDNDLLFITQHEANIDKQIRRLATYSHRIRNMQKFKIPGIGRLPPPWCNRFVLSTYDQGGTNLLSKEWVKMDREIFACYTSKSMRGKHKRSGMAIPKKHLEKIKPSNQAMIKQLLIFGLLIVIATGWWAYNIYRHSNMIPAHVSAVVEHDGPSRPLEVPSHDKGSYEAVEEVFRATDGSSYMVTTADEYDVGELCLKGMVLGVRNRTVKIASPDGHMIYVIGRDSVSGSHQEMIVPEPNVSSSIGDALHSLPSISGSAFHPSEVVQQANQIAAEQQANPSPTPFLMHTGIPVGDMSRVHSFIKK